MSSNNDASAEIATEIASVIQAGHIRSDPDPDIDMAPGTAADDQKVLNVNEKYDYYSLRDDRTHAASHPGSIDEDYDYKGKNKGNGKDQERGKEKEDIPCSVLKPPGRRRQALPPLPDLRFEQSYLKSISNADTWWKIALITTRDQVFMPLVQGVIYNLVICGWQQWNRNAKLQGNSVGARVRRWWYGVNNWTIPSSGQYRQYRR